MGSLLLNSTSSQGIFTTDWSQFVPSIIATLVASFWLWFFNSFCLKKWKMRDATYSRLIKNSKIMLINISH